MDPFRFGADGVVSSARLRRPAELTTITASRYRARSSRPSAPLLRLRGIFLMAQPPLLCEEGNMTHSSSVPTATSSTFGCGSAALCLLWLISFLRYAIRRRQHIHKNAIDPFRWQVAHRIAHAVLPPIGDRGKVMLSISIFGDGIGILPVNHHIDRVIDISSTDAGRIECKAADFERETEAVLILK